MSDPKRSELSASDPFLGRGDFQEDLGMFEAATHGAAVELPDVAVRAVLFAPDGSNQDPTARAVARAVADAVGAQVTEKAGLVTVVAIQAARQAAGADLLVMPIPFGSDYSELREESLGDVADRVLATCLPILAVRQLFDESVVQAMMRNVVVPLSPDNPRNDVALAWAARLLGTAGTLSVVEIADAQLRAEAREMVDRPMKAVPASVVGRVLTRHFAGCIAAIQRKALDRGFQTRVSSTGGRFVESSLAQLNGSPGLMIVAGASDRRSDAYHHEADLILASRYPVLIV